jgi:hypothetical protein
MKWFRVDLPEGEEIQSDNFLFFYEQLSELLREKEIKIEQTKEMADKQGKLLPFHLKNGKLKPNVCFKVIPKNKLIPEDLKLIVVFSIKTNTESNTSYTGISGILDISFDIDLESSVNFTPEKQFNPTKQNLAEFTSREIERSLNLIEEFVLKGQCGFQFSTTKGEKAHFDSFNDAKNHIVFNIECKYFKVWHTNNHSKYGSKTIEFYGFFKDLYKIFKDVRRRKLLNCSFLEYKGLEDLKGEKFNMLTDYSSGRPVMISSY